MIVVHSKVSRVEKEFIIRTTMLFFLVSSFFVISFGLIKHSLVIFASLNIAQYPMNHFRWLCPNRFIEVTAHPNLFRNPVSC